MSFAILHLPHNLQLSLYILLHARHPIVTKYIHKLHIFSHSITRSGALVASIDVNFC